MGTGHLAVICGNGAHWFLLGTPFVPLSLGLLFFIISEKVALLETLIQGMFLGKLKWVAAPAQLLKSAGPRQEALLWSLGCPLPLPLLKPLYLF